MKSPDSPASSARSDPRRFTLRLEWLVGGVAVAVGVLMVWVAWYSDIAPFQFRYNPYALLSISALIANIIAFYLIARLKSRADGVIWFMLHLLGLSVWAGAEALLRLSATPQTALFWAGLGTLIVLILPVTLFMFALSYTHHPDARRPGVLVPLISVTVLLFLLDSKTVLFYQYDPMALAYASWGYTVKAGPFFQVMVAWILSLCMGAVLIFAAHAWRAREVRQRRQSILFAIAISIPLIAGGITDGILPVLGVSAVLPIAAMLTSIIGVVITYGLLRYRTFRFDAALVATNILATMNEAVVGVRPDLTINYANPGASRLLGYSMEEFLKLKLTSFLDHAQHATIHRKAISGSLDEHEFGTFDSVELRRADGGMVKAKLSISRVVEDGILQGYIVAMTDITQIVQSAEMIERRVVDRTRELHEARATLVTSINSLKLGFIITDAALKVTMVNTVAHDLFCTNRHSHTAGECREVTLKSIQAFMGDSMHIGDNIKSSLKRQLPHERKNVSFGRRDWRVYVSPMVVDRVSIGSAVLFQDTTQERMLERSRDEFFSIASHELRTPLTSIKGNSAMIMQYYAKLLKDPILGEMVTDIHESSERLIEIVNDFLDISRLEQGRIEFHLEQLSAAKVVEEVVYGMQALIKQKGLSLNLSHNLRQLDDLPPVIVDKNRLKQVLFNLLGNATKFTAKGDIWIEAIHKQDMIKIAVRDTGPGISPEYQGLLFHKFQQAKDNVLTRDSSNSTGLGLYISRMLAEGMGGSLILEKSAPGKGSTFAVTLPVATPMRLKRALKPVDVPIVKK